MINPASQNILKMAWDNIPEEARREILKKKKGVMSKSGNLVRLQPHIPNDIYVMLVFYGAFRGMSESAYFTRLAIDDLENKLMRIGLMNTMAQHNATGGK